MKKLIFILFILAFASCGHVPQGVVIGEVKAVEAPSTIDTVTVNSIKKRRLNNGVIYSTFIANGMTFMYVESNNEHGFKIINLTKDKAETEYHKSQTPTLY